MIDRRNLASIMAEVTAFAGMANAGQKTASASQASVTDVLDKLAMDLDASAISDGASKNIFNNENGQGAKMNEGQLIDKIATAVLKQLEKIAVDGSEVAPGMEQAQQGTGTQASGTIVNNLQAANKDNFVPGPAVGGVPAGESATDNPNDLVKNQVPGAAAAPIQKGASVMIDVNELDTITKLATVGYNALVEREATILANQQINAARIKKQAQANLDYLAQYPVNY